MDDVESALLAEMKSRVRSVARQYSNREERARRLFVEDRAQCMSNEREREFSIRADVSNFFGIPHTAVSFCGSAQLGFSVQKDRPFRPAQSDLDVACIDVSLYQRAWKDVVGTTRAFSDMTVFGRRSDQQIEQFKDQILRRGMIRVDMMPSSNLATDWSSFQGRLSRKHVSVFKRISVAIYMNEYAFCWKQDSILSMLSP